MKTHILFVLTLAACFAVLGWVGQADYEAELEERAIYCAMVDHGHWPDYRGIAAKECI